MNTITERTKIFLEDTLAINNKVDKISSSSKSVLEFAREAGLTLKQYVQRDPDLAIKQAESSLTEWIGIQETAAIEGIIYTQDGTIDVDKNIIRLLEARIESAERQLKLVNEYAITAMKDGEQVRDHIIRSLYKRGIEKGDTKALIYLIDRVEGRPVEARAPELDYDNAYNVYQIIHTLFNKQLEVLNSGSGTKLICCSRRAGKSYLLFALCLIEALRKPNTRCLYIGETMELTQQILDSYANEIVDTLKIKDKHGNRLNWKKLDNGSVIMVRGLSNTKDPDQIRGQKAKIIVVDEFFHLKSELLEYLQREVLEPMQLDYADEYMFIGAGTPPSIKGTFGEWAWKNWEVPHFFWTFKDNPHPVDVDARVEYVEKILKEKGLDWDSPYARREYLGEWAYDEDLLLYPDFHCYNPRDGVPAINITRVLFGIDYGVGDNDVLVGIAWDDNARKGFIFHEDKFNRLDISDRTISQLQYLKQQVKVAWQEALDLFPTLNNREANKRILWDADDNDQHVTDELNVNVRLKDHPDIRLNIQNAHKTDKTMMQDKIRDLLRTGDLMLIDGGKVADECQKTVFKRGPGGTVYNEIDNSVYHPDALPAIRYALWNAIGQEVHYD